MSSARPHVPLSTGQRVLSLCSAPGATSAPTPKLRWHRSSRGSLGTGMRWGLWRGVAAGDTAALPGPPSLRHQPREGPCPPLQPTGKKEVYQNSVYSKC